MKKNNLEKVLWALEDLKNVIKVDKVTTERSQKAIDRMLEIK